MPHENTEVIKGQMAETRHSLSEKLETLEDKVVQTVQEATNAVSGTVESVKEVVGNTVESVKDVVGRTVGSVRSAVDSTVQTVGATVKNMKESVDVPLQVRRHPWLMFGGAIATGFVLERLCETDMARRVLTGEAFSSNGHDGHEELMNRPRFGFESRAQEEEPAESQQASGGSGIMSGVSGFLGKHLGKVQGLALGALFGVLRNVVSNALAPEFSGTVADMVDDFTRDMGGQVLPRTTAKSPQGVAAKS